MLANSLIAERHRLIWTNYKLITLLFFFCSKKTGKNNNSSCEHRSESGKIQTLVLRFLAKNTLWKYQTLLFYPGIQWWVGDLWWPDQAAAERSWDWLPNFHRLEAPCHPGWVRGHGLQHWTGRGQKADRQTKLESPHIHRPPSKCTYTWHKK